MSAVLAVVSTTTSAGAPSTVTPRLSSTAPSTVSFTQNRQLWDEGPDILALQQWLNANGYPLVSTGWGSPGYETDTFGLHTYAALIKFQQAHELPATGFFGSLTRAAINASTSPSN